MRTIGSKSGSNSLRWREERQLNSLRAGKPHVAITPWCGHWTAEDLRADSDEVTGDRLAVRGSKRYPHRTGNPPANLDLVDRLGLRLIEDFQRRVTAIQEDRAATIVLPYGQLSESEVVSEEFDRLVEVVHSQDQSHFV
jgi:hypothetical protein